MEEYIQKEMNQNILNQAAVLYDIEPHNIQKIGGFENFVFEYVKDNKPFIMRFVHSGHRTFELVLAEIEFIDYLDQNKACVSTVVPSIYGTMVEKITINQTDYFSVSVFEKAEGTYVSKDDLNALFYQMLGKDIGQLHRLTKDFNPKNRRMHWYEENFRDIAIRTLEDDDKDILELFDDVVKKIHKLPVTKDNYGLIHTDLHFRNMYYDQQKLTFFDFDDSAYKHFISDIAIVIYYHFMFDQLQQEEYNTKVRFVLENFLIGYRKENQISTDFLYNLNEFILLRSVILYFVLVAAGYKHSEDPRMRKYTEFTKKVAITKSMLLDLDFVLKGL